MRSSKLLSAAIAGGILLTAAGSMAAADEKGMATIEMKGGSMGAISFPHGRHQAIFVDCKPCHELFPKESQVVDQMMGEGTMHKKDVMNMCKKCHADLTAKGRKAGPTACKGCHVK